MERQSATLVNAMDKKYRQVKAGFLIRDCGAKMHDRNSHCGGGEDGKCCELGSKIYSILRDNKSPEHDITAAPIAQKLRSSYPLFRWSVVIVKDYRDVEILVNPAHIPNVWIQRYGSNTQRLGLSRRVRESLIMSYGLGSYGCFLCYRDKAEPAVLVFFADADAFADPELTNARQQMQTLWNGEDVLRGMLQEQSGTFETARPIRGKVYEVRKAKLLDKAATEVAVKIVSLPISSAVDNLTATSRTVGILDATLLILKTLNNPHVVRHLGLQASPQERGGRPASYRIIMEYCGGDSLASFANGKGGEIKQTIRFARELLDGLAYLHKKNLAHRFFCCEHVLFSGNEPGAGTLKIISVGRVDDAIKICGRSYFPVQERAERFTPPEGNEQYGSKTDVFAFGCVVLHLWKGSRPSYTHFDFQKREEFLRQLDESLRGPIGRCWDMKYDERPSALELLNSIPFKAQ
ncbi:hypothetical protein BV898_10567 [Hypsibius exemplaris]|uniref:non-specific serine/threonine protein kinase n=1 Tax=Hypsibius exemplaris TaxID=2072580 RepID=A0A1W0WJ42_HYPEX|nr:hypothetical protein BV898_10567 [Hypsibius exemplaris]